MCFLCKILAFLTGHQVISNDQRWPAEGSTSKEYFDSAQRCNIRMKMYLSTSTCIFIYIYTCTQMLHGCFFSWLPFWSRNSQQLFITEAVLRWTSDCQTRSRESSTKSRLLKGSNHQNRSPVDHGTVLKSFIAVQQKNRRLSSFLLGEQHRLFGSQERQSVYI